jgi:tetratricopeptide (TPR) repeat protein
VKRAIFAAFLLLGSLAAAYGYVITRRESSHRDHIRRGDAAMAAGDLSTAIEAFSGAITLDGDSMIGYLKRGDAYRRRDELESALRDLRRAAEIDPGAPRPRELMGDVNYARGRFMPAADHYQAYVDLDDRSPQVLYKLGLARYRARQPEQGIDALQKAIAINDRFFEAYYLLGLCQRDASKTKDALKSLERAIASAPSKAPAMLQAREELASLYAKQGHNDLWLGQLEALNALDPQPSRSVTLGLAYAKVGQFERAVITLRHAAEEYPDHRYAYVALGRVWLDAAEPGPDSVELSKALEALEQAIEVEDTSEAYTLLGRAQLMSTQHDLAERTLSQASRMMPADPLAFYYLADAAERRAHFDVARQALLDYLAVQPDELDTRRKAAVSVRVADLSSRVQDFPTAVTYYERAAPAFASDNAFAVRYATARWRAGQNDAARAILEKVLEKDPENSAARGLLRRVR